MKKTFVLLFFLLSWLNYAQAQQERIDSLINALGSTKYDTAKVDILLDLSFSFRNSIPDSTLSYANEALILAREIKYLEGEVLALRNIGMGYEKKGSLDTAITINKKALEVAGDANISTKADAYNTLGTAYYFKGNYDSAAYYFESGAKIFESFNEKGNEAGNYNNIAIIYETQGNYPKALEYYQIALEIFEEENHLNGIATVTTNMGSILEDQGASEEALTYYTRALEIDKEQEDLVGYGISLSSIAGIKESQGDLEGALSDYKSSLRSLQEADAICRTPLSINNIGEIYQKLDKRDSALYYFKNALIISDTCEIVENIITTRNNLGEFYYSENSLRKAIIEYTVAYNLAKEKNLDPDIASIAEGLYLSHKKLGNYEVALMYNEEYHKIIDDLYDEESTREIERLRLEYDFNKEKEVLAYENEINSLRYQEELNKQQSSRNTLITILSIVVLLMLFVSLLYFLRVRTNNKLDDYNKEISVQNTQILQYNEDIKKQNQLLEDSNIEILKQQKKLKKANKELKEMNEEKNTLIGIVAHDLKSPINQIRGLLQIIEIEGEKLSDNIKDYLSKMKSSSERSVNMIDRILDLNAIENKKIEVKIEEVDLNQLLKNTSDSFSSVAEGKSIDITYHNSVKGAKTVTDPLLFQEILDNLVSNSVKFSPQNSKVELSLNEVDSGYLIKIKDEGPGISEEDQMLMYNKYEKVSNLPTGGEKSTGLGLAIVKKYIDELGFDIRCTSSSEGTVFEVYIPVN